MVHSFLSIFTIIFIKIKWDLEISLCTSGVKVHYSFSVCVVNCMSTKKKKKIKNTTCIKTVTLASCGTFIGNFILSRLFIMHFLLTCITIKTTVLTTCMLILMFMLMLQYWSKTVCCKSQFLIPVWMENREQVIENCVEDWASQD